MTIGNLVCIKSFFLFVFVVDCSVEHHSICIAGILPAHPLARSTMCIAIQHAGTDRSKAYIA